jgi:hypothetical protein
MNQLPSSALGTLKLMPSNLQQVAMFSKQLVQSVMDGQTNPLELLVLLRALEKTSETVIDCIRENINSEASKFGEREIEMFGARLEKSEVGTKYDYASSGDVIWEQRDSAVKSAESLRKERETFLRALREPMTAVNEDTGEVFTIRPPMKRSTSFVKVRLL